MKLIIVVVHLDTVNVPVKMAFLKKSIIFVTQQNIF